MAKLKTLLRRHGDVLLKTREGFRIPEETKLERLTLLHKGEQHDHSIKNGMALHGLVDGKRYLRVIENLTIDHPEHGQGEVPAGDYWIEIKSEYDHLEEESRQVVD